MPRPIRLPGRLAGPALAATALALAACAALPDAAAPPVPREPATISGARSFDAPTAAWPEQAWWHAYRDTQLDALIAEGLAGSPSIAMAQARLARAESLAQTSRAADLPQLSANTSITQQRQSNDYLSPRAATPQGWNDYGRATLDLSWDLDFWGRNRAALRAALSDADAARADAAQARLMLAASIASAYAEFVRLCTAEDTAAEALEVRGKTVALFRQRRDNGLETLAAVRQVEARREMAEADLLSQREQVALQR
ncbi:MAG TPA: TolC family protein, partial [Burkholderiaceae bacterium]